MNFAERRIARLRTSSRPHTLLRPPTMREVRALSDRASQLTGPFELDLAAFGFLAQSAPEPDHLVSWVHRALGELLWEVGMWDAEPMDADPVPLHDMPDAGARALVGAAIVLTILCQADSCDPDLAARRLDPAARTLARNGARLALARGEASARNAWAACSSTVDVMGPSIS